MKIIKTLLDIADGKQIEYQGYIYTIYSLVKGTMDKPGIVLMQIWENTDYLITGLKTSIPTSNTTLMTLPDTARLPRLWMHCLTTTLPIL